MILYMKFFHLTHIFRTQSVISKFKNNLEIINLLYLMQKPVDFDKISRSKFPDQYDAWTSGNNDRHSVSIATHWAMVIADQWKLTHFHWYFYKDSSLYLSKYLWDGFNSRGSAMTSINTLFLSDGFSRQV